MSIDPAPLLITLKLCLVTIPILLLIAVPLTGWLWSSRSGLRHAARILILLPLVVPPSVFGFYLLLVLGPRAPLGHLLAAWTGLRFVFSFEGLVLASIILNLPFMINPLISGIESLPSILSDASETLGKSKWQTYWRVHLPASLPAVLTGTALSLAHTIGEFGVVLMIGGKIPGQTNVASIALFDAVESLQFSQAHVYAALLLFFATVLLSVVLLINRRMRQEMFV